MSANSEAMKKWRKRNPDYYKWYYATHPIQHKRHKRMVEARNERIMADPVERKKRLKYFRKYYRKNRVKILAYKKKWNAAHRK